MGNPTPETTCSTLNLNLQPGLNVLAQIISHLSHIFKVQPYSLFVQLPHPHPPVQTW